MIENHALTTALVFLSVQDCRCFSCCKEQDF